MPWVTHPPTDFTQWKQLTASCWDQSQGLKIAGCWEGGKESKDCPWHSEINIWTGRSFCNRKAIESLDRTISLCSVETAAAPLQAGWWPKQGWHPWGIRVCALAAQLAWGRAWEPEEQISAPEPVLPSLSRRHEATQEGFEGRLVKVKGTSCPGMTQRKLLRVCWYKPAKGWILVRLQRSQWLLHQGQKSFLMVFWTFLSYLNLF